jgi:hypothetical protein
MAIDQVEDYGVFQPRNVNYPSLIQIFDYVPQFWSSVYRVCINLARSTPKSLIVDAIVNDMLLFTA